jgi:hypothetical protein
MVTGGEQEDVMRVMALVMGGFLLASPALCGDSFPGTEYVSGKAGFGSKIKGTLLIAENEVRFMSESGGAIFSIPIATVVKATASREHDEGSFGRKAALGVFASKSEEFLQVDTRSEQGAEAVVFKCKKKTSPGMAVKVNFSADKAREQQAANTQGK